MTTVTTTSPPCPVEAAINDPDVRKKLDNFARSILCRRNGGRARAGAVQEADDLVQEVLAKAWSKKDTFDPTKSACGWLHGILSNLITDKARQRARRPANFSFDPDQDGHVAARTDSPADLAREQVTKYLAKVDPRERELLHWRYIDEMEISAIASRLNTSEGSTRTRISRALAQLRHAAEAVREEESR